MKKIYYFFAFSVLVLFISYCSDKQITDPSVPVPSSLFEKLISKNLEQFSKKQARQVSEKQKLEKSSYWAILHSYEDYIAQNDYYYKIYSKSDFANNSDFKVRVSSREGDADLYVYYFQAGSFHFFERSINPGTSSDEINFSVSDLPSDASYFCMMVYAYRTSDFRLAFYQKKSNQVENLEEWYVDLSNFVYVYEYRVLTGFWSDKNYTIPTNCSWPKYKSNYAYCINKNTNLCLMACYMMAVNLVEHPDHMDIPNDIRIIANKISEWSCRYKYFSSQTQSYYERYDYGKTMNIAFLSAMCNGFDGIKGDFTDWSDCEDIYNYNASTLLVSKDRQELKNFVSSKLDQNIPVMANVGIKPSISNPESSLYFDGNIGHTVLIVGVKMDYANNDYLVYFKDPLWNNSKTYIANYTAFLNSMARFSESYVAMSVNGLGFIFTSQNFGWYFF